MHLIASLMLFPPLTQVRRCSKIKNAVGGEFDPFLKFLVEANQKRSHSLQFNSELQRFRTTLLKGMAFNTPNRPDLSYIFR